MTPFLQAAVTQMLPNAGDGGSCVECGFAWDTPGTAALGLVRDGPRRLGELLDRAGVSAPIAGGPWSSSAYVWHVGDVTRAWSERLHSLGKDPDAAWAGFDPDELARARHYEALPRATAPWALERAVEALDLSLGSLDTDAPFEHPEWGHGTVADALRWLAHEVVHHELDLRRLDRAGNGPVATTAR